MFSVCSQGREGRGWHPRPGQEYSLHLPPISAPTASTGVSPPFCAVNDIQKTYEKMINQYLNFFAFLNLFLVILKQCSNRTDKEDEFHMTVFSIINLSVLFVISNLVSMTGCSN